MAEYLEREDLIKRLESRIKDYGRDCNSRAPIIANVYKGMLFDVKHMQKADAAEVKHGKWIKFDPRNKEAVKCSNCDYSFSRIEPKNYCPNCGAKMNG